MDSTAKGLLILACIFWGSVVVGWLAAAISSNTHRKNKLF